LNLFNICDRSLLVFFNYYDVIVFTRLNFFALGFSLQVLVFIKLFDHKVVLHYAPFSFKFVQEVLLFHPDMLQKLIRCHVNWQNRRLDALINIALAVGRWENHYARETILRETVNTIIVTFVVHPEVVFFQNICFSASRSPRFHA